ncbi:uncharacterized protein LOC113157854 [Anabas testudineus]|uniref:uncharacterized protein LOC113157854 n=1 Tax=Anabas testudineus TaxID=64144 RepID=UPI000E464B80|nr:uncharacterized protein LOC113157854 [Anabas testudineus]
MCLKENGLSFGVFLVSTVTLIIVTQSEHTNTHLDAKPAGDRPERRLWTRMEPSARHQRSKDRQGPGVEVWVDPSLQDSDENCSKGKIQQLVYGRFYIVGDLELDAPGLDRSGSAAPGGSAAPEQERTRAQRVRASEESWQRLQPVVECGHEVMTLTVRRRRRSVQLQLDRVNESSVPLSQLPPHCGYSVHTTVRDVSLKVRFNACHVTQEGDHYVLPLLWRGSPVKMSCPVSQVQPQDTDPSSLCCSPYGMKVKVQGASVTEELRVNVRGEWTPLVVLVEQCDYTLNKHHDEIVITAPFVSCGITMKVRVVVVVVGW